ncbi:hypothetical protein SAMN05446635_9203 [Burkholderia sp. OK233]|nr:hypothetical protein SAMN05446635_9203 [Burkholderia sp. OK233]
MDRLYDTNVPLFVTQDVLTYLTIAVFHVPLLEVNACVECMKKFVVAIEQHDYQLIAMRDSGG